MQLPKSVVLVLFIFVGLWVVALEQKSQLQNENAALKAEIVEWQYATRPAMEAAGWYFNPQLVSEIRPKQLVNALNPCTDLNGIWLDTKECRSMRIIYYQGQGPPSIKISFK